MEIARIVVFRTSTFCEGWVTSRRRLETVVVSTAMVYNRYNSKRVVSSLVYLLQLEPSSYHKPNINPDALRFANFDGITQYPAVVSYVARFDCLLEI